MDKITSSIKKLENGNIEILFSIPAGLVLSEKSKVLAEFGNDLTIAGFRKGKAPISKVEENISDEKVVEHILNHLLPQAFVNACEEHKIRPAIYPKFEVLKITTTKDLTKDGVWEIKAVTAELPEVVLPKDIKAKLKKTKDENQLIKKLVDLVDIRIPEVLINEEVNIKLSQVLERIEKLGLTLEGYLKSVGKDSQKLRQEYKEQAVNSISLELILNKIAADHKIEVSNLEIDEFIKTTGEKKENVNKEKRELLSRILMRKKALEFLKK